MSDVCILLHGIEADPTLRLWVEEFAVQYQHLTPARLIPRKYGYQGGFGVWANAFTRKDVVDHEEAYFRGIEGQMQGLLQDLEPGAKVHIIGHSLGGYIETSLAKRGIKFGSIAHLWGSTVANFDWYKVDSCFDKVRVYYSPNDEILTESSVGVGEDPELALGLMGKIGPTIAHPRVELMPNDWLHTQFMDYGEPRDKFIADLLGWIGN